VKTDRKSLLSKLLAVAPAVASKGIMEQGQCFLFRKGRAAAFDGEVACFADVGLEADCAVPAKPLLDLLGKLPEDEIDVEFTDSELNVKGKRRKSGIRLEAKVVNPIDGVGEPGKWRSLPDGFSEACDLVRRCCSSDQSQFVITCVHVTPEYVEASDRFQIARHAVESGIEPCMVRAKALAVAAKSKPTEFSDGEEWLHFRNADGIRVSVRRYPDKFPLLEKHLEIEGRAVKLLKESDLKGLLDRAGIFADEDREYVTVELRPGKLKVTARGSQGWYSEVGDVGFDGDPLSFTVAPEVLLEVVRRTEQVIVSEKRLAADAGPLRFVVCTGRPKDG